MISPWLTVREAADYARRSPSTVRKALNAGELIGSQGVDKGKWTIRIEAVDCWLEGVPYVPNEPPRVTRRP